MISKTLNELTYEWSLFDFLQSPLQKVSDIFCQGYHFTQPCLNILWISAAVEIVDCWKKSEWEDYLYDEADYFFDDTETDVDEEDCFDYYQPLGEQLQSFELHRYDAEEFDWNVERDLRQEWVLADGVDAVTLSAEEETAVKCNGSSNCAKAGQEREEAHIIIERSIWSSLQLQSLLRSRF